MPRPATLRYWRATQGEFGAEVNRLIDGRRTQLRRAMSDRRRVSWDDAAADRVLRLVGRGHSYKRLRRLDPSLPGGWVIERWRRERPDFAFDLKVNSLAGRRARITARMAAVLDPLRDGIIQGGSLASLGGRHGLPVRNTLYRWVAGSPDFARQIAQACEHREDWYADQILMIGDDAHRLGATEARRRMAPLSRQAGRLKTRPGKRWLG